MAGVELPHSLSSCLPVFPSARLPVRSAGGKSVAGAKISLLLMLICEKPLLRGGDVSLCLRRKGLRERILSRNGGALVARAAHCLGIRWLAFRRVWGRCRVSPGQLGVCPVPPCWIPARRARRARPPHGAADDPLRWEPLDILKFRPERRGRRSDCPHELCSSKLISPGR